MLSRIVDGDLRQQRLRSRIFFARTGDFVVERGRDFADDRLSAFAVNPWTQPIENDQRIRHALEHHDVGRRLGHRLDFGVGFGIVADSQGQQRYLQPEPVLWAEIGRDLAEAVPVCLQILQVEGRPAIARGQSDAAQNGEVEFPHGLDPITPTPARMVYRTKLNKGLSSQTLGGDA